MGHHQSLQKENGMTGRKSCMNRGFNIDIISNAARVQSQIEDVHGRTLINDNFQRSGSSKKKSSPHSVLNQEPCFPGETERIK